MSPVACEKTPVVLLYLMDKLSSRFVGTTAGELFSNHCPLCKDCSPFFHYGVISGRKMDSWEKETILSLFFLFLPFFFSKDACWRYSLPRWLSDVCLLSLGRIGGLAGKSAWIHTWFIDFLWRMTYDCFIPRWRRGRLPWIFLAIRIQMNNFQWKRQ